MHREQCLFKSTNELCSWHSTIRQSGFTDTICVHRLFTTLPESTGENHILSDETATQPHSFIVVHGNCHWTKKKNGKIMQHFQNRLHSPET